MSKTFTEVFGGPFESPTRPSLPIPPLESLDKYFPSLARIVAETSWLPHPDTVRALGGAVFPTRRSKPEKRGKSILENGKTVGVYDDNLTPRWALLWAHGCRDNQQRRRGWAFVHLWPRSVSDDINSYTHLANLAMIPECFASLTDKDYPVTGYLRWHAWSVYGWKPDRAEQPRIPMDYNIQWRYFQPISARKEFIKQQLAKLDNERVRKLRPIIEATKWPTLS